MTVRHYWNHSHSYNFHLWVHLCLFKFLFSANTLLQTSHLKHWRWDLFLCLSSFFLWWKSPTSRNVTFTFLAVFYVILEVFHSLKDFCRWGMSCPPVHPYLGLPCISVLFPSSPVLRKASVNAYPLCLQCVSLLVKIPVCCCNSIKISNVQFCSLFSNSSLIFFCTEIHNDYR